MLTLNAHPRSKNKKYRSHMVPGKAPRTDKTRGLMFQLGPIQKSPTHGDVRQLAMTVSNPPYFPAEVLAIYGLPLAAPNGNILAIIELGGGVTQSDIALAANAGGYPVPNVVEIAVDASPDPSDTDASGEVALDYQVGAGVISGVTGGKAAANIRIYYANDIATAVQAIIADIKKGIQIRAVSVSWGNYESGWGNSTLQSESSIYQQLSALGVWFFASSGDNNSGDGARGTNVDFPASSPYVVGCGGTNLQPNGTEVVWDTSRSEGTGGGYSAYFGEPPYQTGVVPNQGNMRMVPDVSGPADPDTGYNIVLNGSWGPIGGTSGVSPFWAALMCAYDIRPQSGVSPLTMLYAAFTGGTKNVFKDIVQGNNGAYQAAVGPDPCTGLGSPGINLVSALQALQATATVLPVVPPVSPAPVVPPTVPPTVPPVVPPVSPAPTPQTFSGVLNVPSATLSSVGLFGKTRTETVSLSGQATLTMNSNEVHMPQKAKVDFDKITTLFNDVSALYDSVRKLWEDYSAYAPQTLSSESLKPMDFCCGKQSDRLCGLPSIVSKAVGTTVPNAAQIVTRLTTAGMDATTSGKIADLLTGAIGSGRVVETYLAMNVHIRLSSLLRPDLTESQWVAIIQAALEIFLELAPIIFGAAG